MRKDQKKLDRKRRKRQEEKKRQARRDESLAYLGNKYKADELIPTWMHTEIGIYETYVMTDRKLVDQTVVSSLERLIRMLRAGSLPPLTDADAIHYEVGQEEDLLIENVRRNWANHFATEWQPPKDKLIGILRSILGSIQKVKSPGPQSQSYMKHIAGFLTKKLGVSVKAFTADRKPIPDPDDDELVRRGRQWDCDGDLEARAELFELIGSCHESAKFNSLLKSAELRKNDRTWFGRWLDAYRKSCGVGPNEAVPVDRERVIGRS